MNEQKDTYAVIPATGEVVDLTMTISPEQTLRDARQAATALQDVMKQKKDPVIFNKEQYLEFEDWQTIGRFYNVTAEVEWSRFIEFGPVRGFEARAVARNALTGQVVSAAEAMCLNDEDRWHLRPKYEFQYVLKDGTKTADEPETSNIVWVDNPNKPGKKMPKKDRVQIGEEAVPLYQLRSMAQTRACAKALRNVLSWVVVLAGYKSTPAEELAGIQPPQETSTNGTTSAPAVPPPQSSPAVKEIFKMASQIAQFQITDASGIVLDSYNQPKINYSALGLFFKEKGMAVGSVKDMTPEQLAQAKVELEKLQGGQV